MSDAEQVPVTSQDMWNAAYERYAAADIMLRFAKEAGDPVHIIRAREKEVRIWKGVTNMVDFFITNRADVDKVIRSRKARERAYSAAEEEPKEPGTSEAAA
jgi:hypothetical protein